MSGQILPELEKQLKMMLQKVKEPLISVNKLLYEKMINEEQKSDHMVDVFKGKLDFA